jgi:hypothetical protein
MPSSVDDAIGVTVWSGRSGVAEAPLVEVSVNSMVAGRVNQLVLDCSGEVVGGELGPPRRVSLGLFVMEAEK